MFGRRFFGNVWDPYSVAYAYPRPQYYRARADENEAPEARSSEQPLNKKTVKTVKTIPVTDGVTPDTRSVSKSKDAAATEIQAFFRGYAMRKTHPLQHLRLIKEVKRELESLKIQSQETEQRMKLCQDSKERLRWTEGVMALLLRLDSLQGVHPAVRLIRKAVTKELLVFQEMIDSMSSVRVESNNVSPNETIDKSGAASLEAVEEFGIEDNTSTPLGQYVASEESRENSFDGPGIKLNEDSVSEKPVPLAISDLVTDSAAPHCDENGSLAIEPVVEAEILSRPSSPESRPEALMDAEDKESLSTMSPAHHMEESEVKPESPQRVPLDNLQTEMDMSDSGVNNNTGDEPTLLEENGSTCVDGRAIPATISALCVSLKPHCKQDGELDHVNTLPDHALLLQVLEENQKLREVLGKVLLWGKLQSDGILNLTQRIAQLEEHRSPSKLAHGKDRKRQRSVGGSRGRFEKGRKNRRQICHDDLEDWHSVESDEYF